MTEFLVVRRADALAELLLKLISFPVDVVLCPVCVETEHLLSSLDVMTQRQVVAVEDGGFVLLPFGRNEAESLGVLHLDLFDFDHASTHQIGVLD